MPKYLCLQRSLPGGDAENPSPAQMQEMYAKFNDWREKFQKNLSVFRTSANLGCDKLKTIARKIKTSKTSSN